MIRQTLKDFDIRQIADSGQCFRLRPVPKSETASEPNANDTYSLTAWGEYLEISQEGTVVSFSCTEEELESRWKSYFDLETDYQHYLDRISGDDLYLTEAARFGSGIRILRQDTWEMIITFILSQQNNIPRIRRCIANICERYGERRQNSQGRTYDTFPRPEALAEAREEDLRDCNLGYRSKYVLQTARSVAAKEVDLELVARMDYPAARRELLRLYGVGEKVADCICLFGMHCLEAFPVDTHIRQALKKHYPVGFPMERYMGCQGVIQQYIFYRELMGQ